MTSNSDAIVFYAVTNLKKDGLSGESLRTVSTSVQTSSTTKDESHRVMQVFEDRQGRRLRLIGRVGVCAAALLLLLGGSVMVLVLHGRWAGTAHVTDQAPAGRLLPFVQDVSATSAWAGAGAPKRALRVAGIDALKYPQWLVHMADAGHLLVLAPYSGRAAGTLTALQLDHELAASQIILAGVLGREAVWADCGTRVSSTQMRHHTDRGLHCITAGVVDEAGMGNATLAQFASVTLLPASAWHHVVGVAVQMMIRALDLLACAALLATLAMFVLFPLRFVWAACAMLRRARQRHRAARPLDAGNCPPVTVIVPAYNEERGIVATVRSVLACRYPAPLHVLVVDDGSRDGTFAAAQAAFADHPQVRLLRKSNGGKSTALNMGIAHAHTPVVVCIDADTQLDADALWLLCRHFADPQVAAVAGNPKVGNRCNLLTRVQALEYVVINSVERQALEGSNAISCISGALGAYRRDCVEALGGFVSDTLAEDTDMTLRILRSGARIVYEDDAVAWTEAPETLREFMKQRMRWMFGTVQAAIKHRGVLFSRCHGRFGMVVVPNVLLFQVGLGCVMLPLADITMLLVALWLALDAWVQAMFPLLSGLLAHLQGLHSIFYALVIGTTIAAVAMAAVVVSLDRRERLAALVWLFPMQLVLRVLLGLTAYRSLARCISGRVLGWGHLKRTGHVKMLPVARGGAA